MVSGDSDFRELGKSKFGAESGRKRSQRFNIG